MFDYAKPENEDKMCLDWNDTIEVDGGEFIILEPGDYNFTVTSFERGRFPGGAKIPACNKASMTLTVHTAKGIATTRLDLLLYKTLEWKLSSFFRCIGAKKSGEKLLMDWDSIQGSKGRAHFRPRNYTDREGNPRQANEVDRFYDYDEKNFAPECKALMVVPQPDEIPF